MLLLPGRKKNCIFLLRLLKIKADKGRFGSISAMLGEVLFPEGNDGGDLHYEAGIDWRAEKKKKNVSVVPSFPAGIYRSIEPGNRLHLRLQGKGVFGEGKDRTYGTLMHRILSQIETLDRIDDTIAGVRPFGRAFRVGVEIDS